MNYQEIFSNKVEGLANYIQTFNIKSLVIGLSGGIDSTLSAVIASKACKIANVPLIGRSLPCNTNSDEEQSIAAVVGHCFCTDFKEVNLQQQYESFTNFIHFTEDHESDRISKGNIKARLRMMYLYHVARENKGIVIDTDNKTEHTMGFWTIHGDEGDLGVLNDLYKTEVFELGWWIFDNLELNNSEKKALKGSLLLQPTDGNGTDPDLVQYGEPSFERVDSILREIKTKEYISSEIEIEHPILYQRVANSWFKREHRPLYISIFGKLETTK